MPMMADGYSIAILFVCAILLDWPFVQVHTHVHTAVQDDKLNVGFVVYCMITH